MYVVVEGEKEEVGGGEEEDVMNLMTEEIEVNKMDNRCRSEKPVDRL